MFRRRLRTILLSRLARTSKAKTAEVRIQVRKARESHPKPLQGRIPSRHRRDWLRIRLGFLLQLVADREESEELRRVTVASNSPGQAEPVKLMAISKWEKSKRVLFSWNFGWVWADYLQRMGTFYGLFLTPLCVYYLLLMDQLNRLQFRLILSTYRALPSTSVGPKEPKSAPQYLAFPRLS
jgi:hypothetical protein